MAWLMVATTHPRVERTTHTQQESWLPRSYYPDYQVVIDLTIKMLPIIKDTHYIYKIFTYYNNEPDKKKHSNPILSFQYPHAKCTWFIN